MPADVDAFRDLLDRWEDLRDAGQDPDIDELCRDCPQFTEQLRDWAETLKRTEWLSRSADEAAAETFGAADQSKVVEFQKNQAVGEYLIVEPLGSGGMGRVVRAVHRKLQRNVALKLLPSTAVQSPESVERFHREIQALARLSHPNIVAIHDAGKADGVDYFVMDLVVGRDLARVVHDDGPLPPDRAIDCVLQAARGLEYAHAAGIVHRDIKPSNLMLDAAGKIHILDLGIARVEATDEAPMELTKTGAILGTVDYMPPEQALNIRKADQRADVYSLGCTLYFLLAGRPVYEGGTVMERLVAHREIPVPSLRKVCTAAPAWLDQVFQRMVAKLPEARLQSMAEVIFALEQQAPPRPGRPRRRIALLVCLLAIALGIGGVVARRVWHAPPAARTWRMAGDTPRIDGVWKQWDGIVLQIKQEGEKFSAESTFGQPGLTVHWRADGTITPDGVISAQLAHTEPPRPEPAKPQICTAQLQGDGTTIRGHAAWTNGGDDFTWRLQGANGPP
jgi:hypothetical protein